jgi:hypothetical protein
MHNTSNSQLLTPRNIASSQEWRLQHLIASKGPIRHHTNLWHKAITLNSRIRMVGRPTKTLLLVLPATPLMCIRVSLLTMAGTCCLHSKSHLKNPQRYHTNKTSPSNKCHEASRLRRMLEGRNIIRISSLWHLRQRLVWVHRKIHG